VYISSENAGENEKTNLKYKVTWDEEAALVGSRR